MDEKHGVSARLHNLVTSPTYLHRSCAHLALESPHSWHSKELSGEVVLFPALSNLYAGSGIHIDIETDEEMEAVWSTMTTLFLPSRLAR